MMRGSQTMDKRPSLIIGLLLLMVSCNTFAHVDCTGSTIYNESCNNVNISEGCGNYYTLIDGDKYECGYTSLDDEYCDADLSLICGADENCTDASKNINIFNFGTEVVGDVVNTWVIDYTCEGNKYYACFWNSTVPAVIPDIYFYNRNSLTINSTYSNTYYLINYSELPSTEYSPGFIINCNNTYICVSNSSEINESTMIETTHEYSVSITSTNCSTTTSTTTTSSSTSSTSSSSSSSSSPSSSTSSSPTTTSGTPSTVPGTTLYAYSFPNGSFGTLPGLNGTGGITINNGTLKNMPCTGFCIIGLDKEEFQLYAAIMITILVLIAIKPLKLGATASAISLLFFNNIMGWTVITGSLMVIFVFVALATWYMEGK